jgi:hypothetical protein
MRLSYDNIRMDVKIVGFVFRLILYKTVQSEIFLKVDEVIYYKNIKYLQIIRN